MRLFQRHYIDGDGALSTSAAYTADGATEGAVICDESLIDVSRG
jgi:hypothetical protein